MKNLKYSLIILTIFAGLNAHEMNEEIKPNEEIRPNTEGKILNNIETKKLHLKNL